LNFELFYGILSRSLPLQDDIYSSFHPDYTVATGVSPIRAISSFIKRWLVECTTDYELHSTPKEYITRVQHSSCDCQWSGRRRARPKTPCPDQEHAKAPRRSVGHVRPAIDEWCCPGDVLNAYLITVFFVLVFTSVTLFPARASAFCTKNKSYLNVTVYRSVLATGIAWL